MAEETQNNEVVDEEFEAFLAGLDDDEGGEQEDKALKVAEKTRQVVKEFITEQKTDDMLDKFTASAPEEARRLLDIWRKGDEDPKQLKALMELATTKASEAEKPVDEEQIEE